MSNGGAVAAIILKRQKQIMEHLRQQGAFAPDRAVPLAEVPYSNRWYFDRLCVHGAVKREGESCWLDEAAAQEFLRLRSRWVAIALVVILVIVAAVIIIFRK